MFQMRKVCGLAVIIGVFTAHAAFAQAPAPSTSKFFASINIGGQLAPRNLDTLVVKTVYDEPASAGASLSIGKGLLPDFGFGYRVYDDFFVGVTFSTFSTSSTANIRTIIPDPLFTDRFKESTLTQSDVKHKEFGVIPQLFYTAALADKIDLVAGLGVGFIRVTQDIPAGDFSVATGTQNVTLTTSTEKASAKGIAASVGVNYQLSERLSLGGLVRFMPAKVTISSGAKDLNVAGMQAGGGIRVNF